MKPLRALKQELLNSFHVELAQTTLSVVAGKLPREDKARQVNSAANAIRVRLSERAATLPEGDRANYSIVLQYCFSVVSLEYRHQVWPYEYMAFSRRVGELWESFCSAAWDYPSRSGVLRITTPSFDTVRKTLLARLKTNIGNHDKKQEITDDINTLFEIVGEINMKEDEVFAIDGLPHVIDFKSGFGSNEKGNMLRLLTVGKAYRIWNHQTKLLLLVRQEQNNNYLRVLRRSGLWEVYTGAAAYGKISEFTGADMASIRTHVVDWPADVSTDLYEFLKSNDLTPYLAW